MDRLTNILSLLFAKQYILVVHDRFRNGGKRKSLNIHVNDVEFLEEARNKLDEIINRLKGNKNE